MKFLDELRSAKDRAEFDQFMSQRQGQGPEAHLVSAATQKPSAMQIADGFIL